MVKQFMTIVSMVFLIFSFGQKKENNHVYKNIIISAHGGLSTMNSDIIGTGGYALNYRLDNLKHAFGIRLIRDINMNNRSETLFYTSPTGIVIDYKADSHFLMTTLANSYRYYFKNPSIKKATFNTGALFGLCLQNQLLSPAFGENISMIDFDNPFDVSGLPFDPIEDITKWGVGFTVGSHFGLEYATKYFLFFIEANVGYTFISPKITFFETQNVVNTSLRLGAAFELFEKSAR